MLRSCDLRAEPKVPKFDMFFRYDQDIFSLNITMNVAKMVLRGLNLLKYRHNKFMHQVPLTICCIARASCLKIFAALTSVYTPF